MSNWQIEYLLLLVPTLLFIAAWWLGRGQKAKHKLASQGQWVSVFICSLGLLLIFYQVFISSNDLTNLWVNTKPLNLLMLTLVLVMTWVLIKFSRNYMAGDVRLGYYYRWMLMTLGAVALTVLINHLLIFLLGWISISLALHKLLTYYPERQRALLAAHKKFMVARTAELSLLLAILLLYQQHQTFFLSDISTAISQQISLNGNLSVNEHIAAVLIAFSALIKCAQLPLHGWLIQVVESPTPVSALLHAGVINLGGFLLMIFAPLFMAAIFAQWLVLIVAGLSTLLSALIMTTRVSYKVRLAWSTSSQMGLMLIECALGMYELALMHLLAHSAYKAYAFLNAGHAVYEDLNQQMSPQVLPGLLAWLMAFVGACSLVLGAVYWLDYQGPWSVWLIFGLALMVLLVQRPQPYSSLSIVPMLIFAGGLLICYVVFKSVVGFELQFPISDRVQALSLADLWVIVVFLGLFIMHLLLFYVGHIKSLQIISMKLYAGLYLDEWFTRLTLRLWRLSLTAQHRKNSFESINSTNSTNTDIQENRHD